MMMMRKLCLLSQGEIRRGLLKCVLVLCIATVLYPFIFIYILEWNLEFDMYTEVMSIDNGQTSTFLSFNRT